jgi:hypothetical protein
MSLFNDPIRWTQSAVGTWVRFLLIVAVFVALQFLLIHVAINDGWFVAGGVATFLVSYQIMFLYALRRLLLGKSHTGKDAVGVA